MSDDKSFINNDNDHLIYQIELLKKELEIRDIIERETIYGMDLEIILSKIADLTIELLKIDFFNYALLDDSGHMHLVSLFNSPEQINGISKSKKDLSYYIFLVDNWKPHYLTSDAWACVADREKKEIYFPEFPDTESLIVKEQGMTGCYVLPIIFNENTYCSILFMNYENPLILSEFEKELIRGRVKLIGKVIENAKLYEKINKQNELLEARKKVIDQDLMLASLIQKNFIPQKYPESPFWKISCKYIPMSEVGGDYFDFLVHQDEDKNGLGILITDASGHGVSAAFITSMMKMAFDTEILRAFAEYPDRVLKLLNSSIIDKAAGNFVTAIYAYFDLNSQILKVSCAGNNPLYLIRQNNITEIHPGGRVLGLMDNIEPEVLEIELLAQDRLFFYTDGLTEARNANNIEFENTLKVLLLNNIDKTPEELNNVILSELSRFTGVTTGHYEDDVATITVDFSGKIEA